MYGWLLLMMVSLHGHTFHVALPYTTQTECIAKGNYASILGRKSHTKVKWTCYFQMPGPRTVNPAFPWDNGDSQGSTGSDG